MTKIMSLVVLVSVLVAVCWSNPVIEQVTYDEFAKIVRGVPKCDQYGFVRENYLKGYDLAYEENSDVEQLDSDSQFAFAVFKVLSEHTSRTVEEDRDLLVRQDPICFPLPIGCIDPGDSGIRPN